MKKIILIIFLLTLHCVAYTGDAFVYTETSYKGDLGIFSDVNAYQYTSYEAQLSYANLGTEDPKLLVKSGFSAKEMGYPYIFSVYSYASNTPKHYVNVILYHDDTLYNVVMFMTKSGIVMHDDEYIWNALSINRGIDTYKYGVVKLDSPYFPDAFAYFLSQYYKDINPIVVHGSSQNIFDKIILNMDKSAAVFNRIIRPGHFVSYPLWIVNNSFREYSFNYVGKESSEPLDKAAIEYFEVYDSLDPFFSTPFVFTVYFGDHIYKTNFFPAVNIFFLENEVKFVYSADIAEDLRASCKSFEDSIKQTLETYNGVLLRTGIPDLDNIVIDIVRDRDYFASAFADHLYYSNICGTRPTTVVFGPMY